MEKILRIEEGVFKHDHLNMDGFLIITDKQTIKIGISSGQDCCEQTGYFATNDDISDFINSELQNIEITDTALMTRKFKEHFELEEEKSPNLDEGGIMFVNLITDKGILQFTVYNQHNGYYGHTAAVVSEKLTHDTIL